MAAKLTSLVISLAVSLPVFASFSLEKMTLEEKVGQVMMVHFNGETVNEDAKTLVQKTHVGGFIYYNWANGLNSPHQVRNLSSELQKLSTIPLFIAVDQEGGLVARLTKGFTIFPGNKALGMTGDPSLAERSAFAIGQELRTVGINFNLSPVVDVNNNPRNPVIGIRAFGDTTETVIPFAKSAIEGYHRAGIITSLKHYPGHGNVEVDSHEDLPVIKGSKEQLQKTELLPFSELASIGDSVMTAHVIVPSIDPDNCATLSSKVLDILRKEIGYEGVIITDSLVMEGLLKNCNSIEMAAIRALNAGCDILMLGGKQILGAHANLELKIADVERIHLALINAVKSGLVSEKRLNEAVQRILNLKAKYDFSEIDEIPLNTSEHQLLAKKIATLALKTLENRPISIDSFKNLKLAVFAPSVVQDNVEQSSLLKLGKETYSLFFTGLSPNEDETQAAKKIAEKSDILIFCSYNAWKYNSQAALINSLSESKKPFILIPLRDPLDATLFPKADLVLMTFSPTAPSIQAACEKLGRSI